ncbi:MAG: putative Serine/threonine-protein kinase ppk15, partial [Streblomastix strix]
MIRIERGGGIPYIFPTQSTLIADKDNADHLSYELIKIGDILSLQILTQSKNKTATFKVNAKFLPVAITVISLEIRIGVGVIYPGTKYQVLTSSRYSENVTVEKLTLSLCSTFRACSSNFKYTDDKSKFGKILTVPSEAVKNNGRDNEAGDYIFHVGDIIEPHGNSISGKKQQYAVEALLGQGSFGQVFRCLEKETHATYAIKVIKNLPAYTKQAGLERQILTDISLADKVDQHHMLRLVDSFTFYGHFCFVTEMLGIDLYSVMKQNKFRGFSLNLIAKIMAQILDTLALLNDISLIHSDLKPENILLDHCLPFVRVIDFGSAAYEGKTLYTYIQSRYYRSPEVLIGAPYDCHIDMWSAGCITAELFIAHPLFPGISEYDQVARIQKFMGPFPGEILNSGKTYRKFFSIDPTALTGFRFIGVDEYVQRTGINKPARQYSYLFNSLEETIDKHYLKLSKDNISKINEPEFLNFLQFIRMCLQYNPRRRLTPRQALQHPFILGKPYEDNWIPPFDQRRRIIIPLQQLQTPNNNSNQITPNNQSGSEAKSSARGSNLTFAAAAGLGNAQQQLQSSRKQNTTDVNGSQQDNNKQNSGQNSPLIKASQNQTSPLNKPSSSQVSPKTKLSQMNSNNNNAALNNASFGLTGTFDSLAAQSQSTNTQSTDKLNTTIVSTNDSGGEFFSEKRTESQIFEQHPEQESYVGSPPIEGADSRLSDTGTGLVAAQAESESPDKEQQQQIDSGDNSPASPNYNRIQYVTGTSTDQSQDLTQQNVGIGGNSGTSSGSGNAVVTEVNGSANEQQSKNQATNQSSTGVSAGKNDIHSKTG